MTEKMTCTQCGMPCDAGEYHPYAACLMFTACHNSETVRANLAQPAQVVDVAALITDVCDTEPADPDKPDTVCIDVHLLTEIVERHTRAIGNAQAEGWRDIATAPKDGRELILLLTPSRWPQVAYSNTWWTAGFSVECKPTHWMPIHALPTPPTQATPNAHE